MTLMMVSITPMLWKVWNNPKNNEIIGYVICALASFLFGYHVHEKAILLALVPFIALGTHQKLRFFFYKNFSAVKNPRKYGTILLVLSSAGYSGLMPLIFTNFEQPLIIALFLASQFFLFLTFLDQFRAASLIEKAYIISSLPIVCYVQQWSKIVHPQLPFLSLLVQSCYSACGIIYTFVCANLLL